jgi:hypothetical protein
MASNIAHRRAARTAHRRKLLASRRSAEPESLADKVRAAAEWPLHACLIHGDIFEGGICTVFLSRQSTSGEIALAAFLVDVFALGIKDVFLQLLEPSEFDAFEETAREAAPLRPVEPCYARKLVREAAAYAASLGLRPRRGFGAIEQLFGNARAEDCSEEFTFGRDGKPFYVAGPTEKAGQIGRRLGHLTDRLGLDGFDFMIPLADDMCLTNEGVGPMPAAGISTTDGS